jgi:ElaB/YqjD/DUF883 family membrane-anchored ribosome-binding protein
MDRLPEESGQDAAAAAGRSAGDAAASIAKRVGEGLDQGRAALADLQAKLSETTRQCTRTTDAYVRDNPWQAVGIAVGIGVLIGLLLRRR